MPNSTTDSSDSFQDVYNTLAGLCAKTQDSNTRACLRVYDPKHTNRQQQTAMMIHEKSVLVDTLTFLGVHGADDYKKQSCVQMLIIRIQNLLPDNCSICQEVYCTELYDTPLLECAMCGQGSHDRCIKRLCGMDADDLVTKEDMKNVFNPMGIPGFHWMCRPCEESTVPSKDEGKKKSKKGKSVSNLDETIINMPDDFQPLADTPMPGQSYSQPLFPDTPMPEQSSDPPPSQSSQTKLLSKPGGGQPKSVTMKATGSVAVGKKTPSLNNRSMCKFFQRGICRHGMAGKGCNYRHPKLCKKMLNHGTKPPNGCTEGRDGCDKFHPKMCPESIDKGQCYKKDCLLRHVRGTKRVMGERPSSKTGPTGTLHHNKVPTTETGTCGSIGSSGDFLGMLQQLKSDLLAAMDQKLATLTMSPSNPPGALGQTQAFYLVPGGMTTSATPGTSQPVVLQLAGTQRC